MRKVRQKNGIVAYAVRAETIRDWYWRLEVYDERTPLKEKMVASRDFHNCQDLVRVSLAAKNMVVDFLTFE